MGGLGGRGSDGVARRRCLNAGTTSSAADNGIMRRWCGDREKSRPTRVPTPRSPSGSTGGGKLRGDHDETCNAHRHRGCWRSARCRGRPRATACPTAAISRHHPPPGLTPSSSPRPRPWPSPAATVQPLQQRSIHASGRGLLEVAARCLRVGAMIVELAASTTTSPPPSRLSEDFAARLARPLAQYKRSWRDDGPTERAPSPEPTTGRYCRPFRAPTRLSPNCHALERGIHGVSAETPTAADGRGPPKRLLGRSLLNQ